MKNLIEEFNNITLIKCFEIEVIDMRTNETEYILCDISIQDDKLIAQRIALNEEEENSPKIAFTSWDLDDTFSLDENLQTLHELCVNEIIDSPFYRYV